MVKKRKRKGIRSGNLGFKRVVAQEGGNVIYWFENVSGDVMSFVKEPATGDYFLRITYKGKRMEIAFPLSGGFPSGVPPAKEMLSSGVMHIKRGF